MNQAHLSRECSTVRSRSTGSAATTFSSNSAFSKRARCWHNVNARTASVTCGVNLLRNTLARRLSMREVASSCARRFSRSTSAMSIFFSTSSLRLFSGRCMRWRSLDSGAVMWLKAFSCANAELAMEDGA